MEVSQSTFDHIKFRNLIETELGHGGKKRLSDAIGISPKTMHSWINGRTPSGPNLEAWDAIKEFFRTREFTLKREDYYKITVVRPDDDLSEPTTPGYETDDNSTQKLKELVSTLKSGIEQANGIISLLEDEIKHREE